MAVIDRKRRRRADELFHRQEASRWIDGNDEALTLEERHELEAMVRGDDEGSARFAALERLAEATAAERSQYVNRHGVAGVRPFRTSIGATVYMIPVETFPGHINNLYLVADGLLRILVDAGSGTATSRRQIERGLEIVRTVFHVDATFESLDLVVITHAHIDHYGGVNDVKARSNARVAVHELDARVLANFEERLVVATKDIGHYLHRCGVDDLARVKLTTLYSAEKRFFRSVEPDRVLRDGDVLGSGIRIHHVPGHCPGLICVQVGDVLLTSDHVLARITPHQFPQAITPFAGLEHYFRSLERVRRLEGIDLALGGHEAPIHDMRSRIDEIVTFHRVRLARVMESCATPRNIAQVTSDLFGMPEGYGSLLAVLEAGAHVEYLHGTGALRIANLADVASQDDPVILYEARAR